ncbi:hypothetical protein ACEQ8H_002043 [Pleosporales sp. CAS-2024a]
MPFHNGVNGLSALNPPSAPNGHGGYHSSPRPHVGAANGDGDSDLSMLYKKLELHQQHDADKNTFIKVPAPCLLRAPPLTQQELFMRLEHLTQQNDSLKAERQRSTEFFGAWQREKSQYEKCLQSMTRAMSEIPFVMVLIDGDGMIFEDQYLQQGEAGGRRAASQLDSALHQYIETETDDIPLGARIVCRMYANVRGLGEVLARKGIIAHSSVFDDFVRGFTRGKTLFDFVDVGTGKDRADEKIIESFKMFSRDYHCRRLMFGCSHDNGYARTLEEYIDKPEIVCKTVLLEGVPFEKELIPLPYATKKFSNLFRQSKIVLNGLPGPHTMTPESMAPESPMPTQQTYSMFSGLPTRFPAPPRQTGLTDSPLPCQAALVGTGLPRTPSSSTLASDGGAQVKQAGTWASLAAAPAPPPTADAPVYMPAKREDIIARNRAGQRIDPTTKDYDKAEVDRVKKMKWCNVHFLRNACPYDFNCSHEHSPKPNEDEIRTLRLVARMAPCIAGSGCQDINCIYGHRCPAPPHRTNNHVKGTKSCIFGESCKFPPELHDIDMNVVKTLVVR